MSIQQICHSCKLVRPSEFEYWLDMNVNIALMLVKDGLMNNCVVPTVEKPQKPQHLCPQLVLPAEDKGASKKTVHPSRNKYISM